MTGQGIQLRQPQPGKLTPNSGHLFYFQLYFTYPNEEAWFLPGRNTGATLAGALFMVRVKCRFSVVVVVGTFVLVM